MLRERIPMLSAMTLDQLGARMRCDKCVKRRSDIILQTRAIHRGSFEAFRCPGRAFDDPLRGRQFVTLKDATEKRVPYGSTARRPPDVTKLLTSGNIIPSPDFVLSGEAFG
jgi:hypothetical protein